MPVQATPSAPIRPRYMPAELNGNVISPAASTATSPPSPPTPASSATTTPAATASAPPPPPPPPPPQLAAPPPGGARQRLAAMAHARGDLVGGGPADEALAVPGAGHGTGRVVGPGAGADHRAVAHPPRKLRRHPA